MIDANGIIVGIISLLPLFLLQLRGGFIYFEISAIAAIALHGWYLFGPSVFLLLLITFIVSTVLELISLKTPVNFFGIKYWYHTNHSFFSTKIRFLNVYPVEISLAWVIFKYLSFCLAMLIVEAFFLPQSWVIFLTPLLLVSLDFIVDPVSVNISKLWEWKKGSRYFGIPWQNFLGWYVVGFVTTSVFSFVNTDRHVTFNILYLLPIIFYGSFINEAFRLFKMNKTMAIIGAIPVTMWTILGFISLMLLYFKQ